MDLYTRGNPNKEVETTLVLEVQIRLPMETIFPKTLAPRELGMFTFDTLGTGALCVIGCLESALCARSRQDD